MLIKWYLEEFLFGLNLLVAWLNLASAHSTSAHHSNGVGNALV